MTVCFLVFPYLTVPGIWKMRDLAWEIWRILIICSTDPGYVGHKSFPLSPLLGAKDVSPVGSTPRKLKAVLFVIFPTGFGKGNDFI